MTWFSETFTEEERLRNNIRRWNLLKDRIVMLQRMTLAMPTEAQKMLTGVYNERLVQANKEIKNIIGFLLQGENNQKVILDNPRKAVDVLSTVLAIIGKKISDESFKIKELDEDDE